MTQQNLASFEEMKYWWNSLGNCYYTRLSLCTSAYGSIFAALMAVAEEVQNDKYSDFAV